MEEFWSMFCGDSSCSKTAGKTFCYDFKLLKDPSSCINHLLVISFDMLVLITLLFIMILKSTSRPYRSPVRYSNLQLVSAIINSSLGLLHLCLGIWVLEEKLRKTHSAFPLNWWLLELFQGCTWLSISFTTSLQIKHLPRAWLWLSSILIFFVSGILCALSLSYAIGSRKLSLKAALDVLSFPAATLLLLCTYKACKCEEQVERETGENLYAPLNRQFNEEYDPVGHVTT